MEMKTQTQLPLRIALEVAMQGIRIRFGRSVVTVMGIVLGIAFLMSILTGQVVKRGVEAEDRLRQDVKRMYNTILAEAGPPQDKTIGVILTGQENESERRLLKALEDGGARQFNWAGATAPETMGMDPSKCRSSAVEDAGGDASLLLVVGGGNTPEVQWDALLADARQKTIAFSRASRAAPEGSGAALVVLERPLYEDEIQKMEADRRRAAFRNAWIVVVSMLVTVMGIGNAMLMSVTERFREIGTMKCLGALSAFIRRLYLIESSVMGVVGGILGAFLGCVFSVASHGVVYGFGLVLTSIEISPMVERFALSVFAGVALSIMAAIYPASLASKMRPADALRTNV